MIKALEGLVAQSQERSMIRYARHAFNIIDNSS